MSDRDHIFRNLFHQVASGVSSGISQLDDGIQSVANNIGEAIRSSTSIRASNIPGQSSRRASSATSRASSQATTPDNEESQRTRGSRAGEFAHPFSYLMGNGGLCGASAKRSKQQQTNPRAQGQPEEEDFVFVPHPNSGSEQKDMFCDNCNMKFSLLARKRECKECHQYFCNSCFNDSNTVCPRCRVLLRKPPERSDLMELRVKDLQRFLMAKKVSMKNCVEKKDLVELVVRENGGLVEQTHNGSLGRQSATGQDGASATAGPQRPVEKPSHNFPKSYVHSTHRQEWFDKLDSATPDDAPVPDDAPIPDDTPVEPMEIDEDFEAPDVDETPVVAAELSDHEDPSEEEMMPQLSTSLPSTSDLPDVSKLRPQGQDEAMAKSCSAPSSPKRFANQGLVYLSDIKVVDEIQLLSAKQAKDILAMNRVNFKGVVEKNELLKFVERLWLQEQKLQSGKDNLDDEELCKICMDNPVDCVMLECGHMCTCTNCGKQMAECPICRQYVVRVVRTFKA